MSKRLEGTNTIKMTIYFHTKQGDLELPSKMAFKRGAVYMPTNHKHGIRADANKRVFFSKSQGKLIDAIKECLKLNEVELIEEGKSNELKKYLEMKNKREFIDKNLDI